MNIKSIFSETGSKEYMQMNHNCNLYNNFLHKIPGVIHEMTAILAFFNTFKEGLYPKTAQKAL